MNLWGYRFLANANLKGGRHSGSVFILLLLSVVSLLLITSFTMTLNHAMFNFTNQDPARRLSIDSTFIDLGRKVLTTELLSDIRGLKHVQSVDMDEGMRYQLCDITSLSDESGDCSNMLPASLDDSMVEAWSLYETQIMDVVSGKRLDECPAFSCLVPSSFCPVNGYAPEENKYQLQNGERYVGKTLTIKPMDSYETLYYYDAGEVGYMTKWYEYPALDYKLKVVGVYNSSYDQNGTPTQIFVSAETGKKIEQMAVEATKNKDFIEQYETDKSKPELHSYTVLVDKAENVAAVRKELQNMNVSVFRLTERSVPDDVGLFASVFTAAGNFFTIAVLLLTVINLFLSTSNNLLERKPEIGLLRALGYKNRQIFFSLYCEQLKLGLRAFFIGGGISAAAVAMINLINANGSFTNRIYVVSWGDFALLACAALLLTAIMPLLCQLIFIGSMTKIQPREAMAAQ